jgi:hypothetical protein
MSTAEPIYGLDKGLNTSTNKILLLPGECLDVQNFYYDSKSLIKRPGHELIKSYTTATDAGFYAAFSYSLGKQGVADVKDWRIDFVDTSAYINGTTNNTLSSLNPAIQGSLTNPGIVQARKATAAFTNDVMYGALIDDHGAFPFAELNYKLNATMSGNLIESFDSASGWSAMNADSAGVAVNTANEVEGTGCLTFSKTGGAGTIAGAIKTVALDLSGFSSYYLCIYARNTSASITALKIRLSTAGFGTDYLEYNIHTSVTSGYKTLDVSAPDATSGATSLSNITQLNVVATVASAATTFAAAACFFDAFSFFPKVVNMGMDAPTVAPSVAVGSATGITGVYKYAYTFLQFDGTESNMSPVSGSVTVANEKVSVSAIAVASSTTVPYIKGRNLYRTRNGGTVYYYVTTITGNTVTTYTDSTSDASLGAIGPTAGDSINDNGKPSLFKYLTIYKNRVFTAGNPTFPYRVFFSDISSTASESESFRTNDYIDVSRNDGQDIRGLYSYNDKLYIFKDKSIWELQGDSASNFILNQTSDSRGTISHNSIVQADGILYFIDRDGFYGYDGKSFVEISRQIKDQFIGLSSKELQSFSTYYSANRQVLLYPSNISTFPYSFAVYHTEYQAWSKFAFKSSNGETLRPKDIKIINEYNSSIGSFQRLNIVGQHNTTTTTEAVYRYHLSSANAILTGDNANSISAYWTSKDLFQTEATVPSSEKIYRFFYLIFKRQSSGTITAAWDFDYANSFPNTSSIDMTTGSSVVNSEKVFLSGASGKNRAIRYKFSNDSTNLVEIYGFQTHYDLVGGDR